jgi:cold shock CspA family protein
MAKSQETWNKKDKENKKKKKREDKIKKKEERKSSPTVGFESMIAYVDEFGNITSTPPDPTKKKEEINAEDIEIGVPVREASEPMDNTRTGIVSYFDSSKGYGFIKDLETQESIFTHVNKHLEEIREGNRVSFKTEKGPKGLNAIEVKKVK